MNNEVYSENYKGVNISISYDDDVQNPFDDWDCEPPIAVYYDRGITEHSTQYGNINSVPVLTREQIKANTRAICSMLDAKSLLEASDRLNERYSDSGVDQINYVIERHVNELYDSERLDVLCDLYAMAGMPAVVKDVHGCSQGDWAKVLAVATPEFQEACGNGSDFDWSKSLEASIQLYEDWAFGNVYGYEIDGGESIDDACWGFFGDYDSEYGALSEAKSIVDQRVEDKRLERIEQIKTWIRNRVPFQYRLSA